MERAACSWLSGPHLTSISSLTVPSVGFGSVPWIRHALTHSTDRLLLLVVTEDNNLSHSSRASHLDWAQEWSVHLYVSARWYVCVIDNMRLQLPVCARIQGVMQLRNGWHDPDKAERLGLSCCFSFVCSFLQVNRTAPTGWCSWKTDNDGFYFLCNDLTHVKWSFGIWKNEPDMEEMINTPF